MYHRSTAPRIRAAAIAVATALLLPVSLADVPSAAAPTRAAAQVASAKSDQLKQLEKELAESDQAVVQAQRALAQSETQFQAAAKAVAAANDELTEAADADAKSQQELEVAEQSEAKVDRELAAVQDRVGAARDTLGRLARDAYQHGTHSPMAVALDAESPRDFATRLMGVQTVLRAENAALADLANDNADLRSSQDRLRAVRSDLAKKRTEAAARLKEKQAAHTKATAAQAQLDLVRDQHAQALAAAEQAREQDKARHAEFLRQSAEVTRAIQQRAATPQPSASSTTSPPTQAAAPPATPPPAPSKAAPPSAAQSSTPAPAGSGAATGSFVRPGTGSVNSPFGMRFHPILRYTKLHTGIDIGVGDGWVYAADAGVVIKAEFNSAYGNMTVIDHGTKGISTLYAHQSSMAVGPGARVTKGQRIGRIGSTGYSTGPHLHFEVRINGQPVDPWPYIKDAPMP
jgi:murein DD-endopeptidase MepM/ murein hydrolase activator NlpD